MDQLANNADVMAWFLDVGLITEEAIQFAWQEEATLREQVRAFRQEMRQMLTAVVSNQPVTATTIEVINDWLQYWRAQPRVTREDGGFEYQLNVVLTKPEHLLAQLAATAANFLTTVNLDYVKRCGNDECIRFFLDTSKNHSRRWCSMEICGNRMKARAFYARGR